jgi:hypothetical protein
MSRPSSSPPAPPLRWPRRGSRTLLLGLVGLAAPLSAAAAPPDDAARFAELVAASMQGGLDAPEQRDRIVDMLVAENLRMVDEIAKERGHPAWFSSDNPVIAERVEQEVRQAVQGSGGGPEALYALGSQVFSGVSAEAAMAGAAGLAAPARSSRRGARPLAQSASVTTPSGPLKLQDKGSWVRGDEGASGHGNGVLDPGETALITLSFENTSKSRLYSTSLYVEGASECLYIGDVVEHETLLPELEPGATAEIALRVFASRHCRGQTARVRLRAHDSNRFAGGLRYDVNLKLAAVGSSRLYGTELDGDDYGHSEPTQGERLAPGAQVELSTGLRVAGGGVASVRQAFAVPAPLTSEHDPGVASFRSSSGVSTAAAADDVDMTVPGAGGLAAGLATHAMRMRWQEPEDAVFFVGVDSVIQAGAAARGGPRTAAVRAATRVDRDAVERVLAAHVTVTPVVERGGGGASGEIPLITVDGFRVSVDDAAALMAALESTSVVSGSARAAAAGGASGGGAREYRVRHYIPLPVAWEPVRVPPECEVSLSRSQLTLGGSLTARGTVAHLPPGATVELSDSRLGVLDLSIDEQGDFRVELEPEVAHRGSVALVVTAGGEEVCADRAAYQAKPPQAPAPRPQKKRTPDWPRKASIEAGFLTQSLGLVDAPPGAAQIGFSVGEKARFASRLAIGEAGWGLGVGPRLTAASQGELTFEVSGQALVGLDAMHGVYGEVLGTAAVHRTVGPFVQAGVGYGANEGRYGSFGVGLGFYFPPR